jgi:hypothetical protein
MAIQEVYVRGQANMVTFTTHDLQFSSSLVKEKELEKFEYARLGVDEELRRVYIGFEQNPEPGLGKFYAQKGRSPRKMISVAQLYKKFDWIKVIGNTKDKTKRQFELQEVDRKDAGVYSKYQYFIELKST